MTRPVDAAMDAVRRLRGDDRARLNGGVLEPVRDPVVVLTEALAQIPAALEAKLFAANEAQLAVVREAVSSVTTALASMEDERRQLFGDLAKQAVDIEELTAQVTMLAQALRASSARIEEQMTELLKGVTKVANGQKEIVQTLLRPVVARDEAGGVIGTAKRE